MTLFPRHRPRLRARLPLLSWRSGARAALGLVAAAAGLALVLSACTAGGVAVEKGWSGPHIDGGFLYIGTRDGKIVSLKTTRFVSNQPLDVDAKTLDTIFGLEKKTSSDPAAEGEWQFPPQKKTTISAIYGTPVVTNDKIFAGSLNRRLYALDRKTGAPAWQPFIAQGDIYGTAALDGDRLVFADDKGYVYSIRAEDGRPVWQTKASGKQFWSSPTVADGVVYIGGMDKTLYALDAERGAIKWTFKAGGAIASAPLVVGDALYVGDFDGKFYAIDRATGAQQGVFKGENWFWNDALYHDGVIYVGDLSGNFYALDEGSLRERWRYPPQDSAETKKPIRAKAVIIGDKVFVANRSGAVTALRLKDGTPDRRDSFAVEARVLASLGHGDGVLYVSGQDQRIHIQRAKTS